MINSEDLANSIKPNLNKSECEKIEPPVVNIINYNNDNSIIINFNKSDYSFGVYDINKNFQGSFSSLDLIKFVTHKIYQKMFLTNNNVDHDSSFALIKKYICDVIFVDDMYRIKLLNHLESPFMANIEMIMNLYQGIVHSNNQIKLEINLIEDTAIKTQVIKILKQFSYVILNYSLRLISQISSSIKNDQTKSQLKDTLLKHSVMIVYKLNAFMRDEIDEKTRTYVLLQDDLVRIGELKLEMYKKINELDRRITYQNNQLTDLKIKFDQLISGQNTKFDTKIDTNLENSSYMFDDDDCHYSESGETKINYLSNEL